ncbi:helix-turn-helix transcriptional regulator [Lipingzhangella sp. LS1_29]|uniref:Helix-turn-helix transcriptional regulator n=1 Tax=Lipingzhangella rawalii TaxID=2055835 RepID=A0ABU2H4F3_9ACTN|nr:helix-turn-helix transcriptional regulator [Lipingzhangella rawalii]MDS1270175.1 helix-turn-helix transcriptional regulator [Lipingzhangella rawalii]
MTQQQLAKAVLLSQSQLSGIELGNKGTTTEQIRRLDTVLNTGGVLLRRWQDMQRSDGYAEWFRGVVPLEQESTEIRAYQPLTVPGLLQTENYARSLIRQGRPTASTDEIDKQVQGRLQRQAVLQADPGPRLLAVVEEHVLRRPIGGRAIMREQLDHLREVATWSRVTVQIVPMNTEQHYGTDGAFLMFTVAGQGTIVYTETRVSGTPLDSPTVVEDYTNVFAELRGVALPPRASQTLLTEIHQELHDD